MANDTPDTSPNDALMAPEASPSTASAAGVRRVNKVPLMIGGAVVLAFLGVVAIVANNQDSQQKPAAAKKETAYSAASQAEEIIGDNRGRAGTIEPARPPALPDVAPGVVVPDTPPMPPSGGNPRSQGAQAGSANPPIPTGTAPAGQIAPQSAPAIEDPDTQRIRMAKLALFEQALKAKSTVNSTPPRSSGSSTYGSSAPGQQTVATNSDVAQRLAQVRAQITAAQESNPTAAYQTRLEQIKALQANGAIGTGTSAAGQSSGSTSLMPVSTPAPATGGGKNGLAQFAGSGGDRWKLDSQVEAPRSPYELRAGFVIPATLISGINSELPGQIMGQVSANVYDTATGKHLLVPQGSRLIGAYSSDVVYGQARVLVAWQRIVFPDGKALDIGSMPGADSAGYGGLTDQVNNHYARIFGSALLMSGVVAGVSYTQQQNQQQTVSTPPSAQSAMSTALGQQLGQVTAQMISKNLSIAPTLEIRPGYRFNVVVVKDLNFSKPYANFDY